MKNVFTLVLCLCAGHLLAQTTYSRETLEKINAFENSLAGRVIIENEPPYTLADRMKFYNVKGLSIAVVHNYEVVWAKGYGWADESEKRPVTPETLFEPGSISKTLNAVGVLKLVQDGKLDLDTDINTYLKSWQFPYDSLSNNKKITLRHLLSHTAGLTVHGFPGYAMNAARPTVPQILDGLPPANTPAVRSAFEPGIRFQYSGGGTTISQLIVTDVTGQPYDVFMYKNVLKPMGMVNSFYTQPPAVEKQALCATGYHRDGSAVPGRFHVYPEQGAAGLWMTPTDLCRFIIATQKAYAGKTAGVLTPEMTRLQLAPAGENMPGLGVFLHDKNGTLYFEHSAGNEGFCGEFFGSMEDGNGVAVFLNSNSFGILPEVVNSVARVYGWKEFYKPVYKRTVTVPETILQEYVGVYMGAPDRFVNILKKEDGYYQFADGNYSKMYFTSETEYFNMEATSEKRFTRNASGRVDGYIRTADGEQLKMVKMLIPDTLQGSEQFFNTLGWSFLENKKFGDAKRYFKRGLKLYPRSLLMEGNLAHCYLFTGNYGAALQIYQAHPNEKIEGNFTWEDMIKQDFIFFKNNGFDKSVMDKVLADLKLEAPEGY
jgi:CubicO group peptidase (beta-lactamase class C family)